MFAIITSIAYTKLNMCEFNRPYPVPFGQHPDDVHGRPQIVTRSQESWERRAEELDQNELAVIETAIQEAARLAADVHLYRKFGSTFIGIALNPSNGPSVKIWEH